MLGWQPMIKRYLEKDWAGEGGLVSKFVRCGLHVESNSHIFLQCPFAINIWVFFLSDTVSILDTHISDVFSLFQFSKFNVTRQCWCIMVLSILWSIWLNRNAVIFRNTTSNLASIFFQIFHFATVWVGTILAMHTSTTSSVSCNPSVASRLGYISGGHLLNAEEHVAGVALAVSREAELDLLVPDPSIADSGN